MTDSIVVGLGGYSSFAVIMKGEDPIVGVGGKPSCMRADLWIS